MISSGKRQRNLTESGRSLAENLPAIAHLEPADGLRIVLWIYIKNTIDGCHLKPQIQLVGHIGNTIYTQPLPSSLRLSTL